MTTLMSHHISFGKALANVVCPHIVAVTSFFIHLPTKGISVLSIISFHFTHSSSAHPAPSHHALGVGGVILGSGDSNGAIGFLGKGATGSTEEEGKDGGGVYGHHLAKTSHPVHKEPNNSNHIKIIRNLFILTNYMRNNLI